MEYTEDQIRELWAREKVIDFNGKKYTVHRMSYGDYFIEPISWKGGEQDGFSQDTEWFEKVYKINQYGYKQLFYK